MSNMPIYNPPIPYLGLIPGGMSPGKMIRVQGTTPPNADRFALNIQCGPGVNPRDDIALHVNVRFPEQCIVRNHLQSMQWGNEDTHGGLPLGPGGQFQLLVLCESHSFKVAVNGNHFCEFPHRLPYQSATYITIDGDVSVNMINFEGGTDMGYQQGPPSYNSAMSQGGAPNMGMMGGPPMGMMGSGQMGGAQMTPPSYGAPPPYPQQQQHPTGFMQQPAAYSYAPVPVMGYQPPPTQMPPFGSGVNPMMVGGVPPMAPVEYKKESSMGMKALKYGLPLAGVGLGAYALGGGFSKSSDSDSDSDYLG